MPPAQRAIDVRKQTRLPLARVFRLVLSGISHRLFRSLLTMSVILLAVAFFMTMLAESVATRSSASGIRDEIEDQRLAARVISFCFTPPSTAILSRNFAERLALPGGLDEYAAVSGRNPAELDEIARRCAREQLYLRFFRDMSAGHRLGLVKKNRGRAIFRHLAEETNWNEFTATLATLRAVQLPPAPERGGNPTTAFKAFIDDFPALEADLQRFEADWRAALSRFAAQSRSLTGVDEQGFGRWLADASTDKAREWLDLARAHAFRIDDDTFAAMRSYLAVSELRKRVADALTNNRELRDRWRRAFPERRLALDDKLALLGRPDAESLVEPHQPMDLAQAAAFYRDPERFAPLEKLLREQTPERRDAFREQARQIHPPLAEASADAQRTWLVAQATPEQAHAWAATFRIALAIPASLKNETDKLLDTAEKTVDIRAELESPSFIDRWTRLRPGKEQTLEERFAYLSQPEAHLLWPRWPAGDLAKVAALSVREQRLNALETVLAAKAGTDSTRLLSGRQIFLLAISFVVCMVGIANAMLMAITERFREIATMKCLGATDGFILMQFMLEASLQGLVGGLGGMLIGLTLAVLRSWWTFGGYFWKYLTPGELALCGLACVATGILLAALASLYPSWAASRMAPMEAMRVE